MLSSWADNVLLRIPPRFVRESLGRMTDRGLRGQDPVLTHEEVPGRNRREKRRHLKETGQFRTFRTQALSG